MKTEGTESMFFWMGYCKKNNILHIKVFLLHTLFLASQMKMLKNRIDLTSVNDAEIFGLGISNDAAAPY